MVSFSKFKAGQPTQTTPSSTETVVNRESQTAPLSGLSFSKFKATPAITEDAMTGYDKPSGKTASQLAVDLATGTKPTIWSELKKYGESINPLKIGEKMGSELADQMWHQPDPSVGSQTLQTTGKILKGATQEIGNIIAPVLNLVKPAVEGVSEAMNFNEYIDPSKKEAIDNARESVMAGLDEWGRKYEELKKTNPVEAGNLEALKNTAEFIETIWGGKKAAPLAEKGAMASAKIAKSIPKGIEKAGAGLGEAMGRLKETVTHPVEKILNPVSDFIVGMLEKQGQDSAIFRALAPTGKKTKLKSIEEISKSYNKSVSYLIENKYLPTGKAPDSIEQFAMDLRDAKKNLWENEIAPRIKEANADINLKPASDKLMELSQSPSLRANKSLVKKLQELANDLLLDNKGKKKSTIDINDAEELKQVMNEDATWGEFSNSDVVNKAKQIISKEIGDQEDFLLSKIPGEFQALKNQYGALKETYADALSRANILGRQAPESTIMGLARVEGGSKLLSGIVTVNPRKAIEGAGQAVLGTAVKRLNDKDLILQRAIQNIIDKLKNPEI